MEFFNQDSIFKFTKERYKITKPIRLISFFSGYDSQALGLKYANIPYEHYKTCEWATKSIQALKDLHFSNDHNDYSLNFSFDEIVDYLFQKGISLNYNNPMSLEQIKRKGEKWCRNVYNNIKATHNLVNIEQVKGGDLEIHGNDGYDYLLTYSFPCQ